ncbi:MAG: hypothetical protein J5648_07830 [Lachnospiraceae bacterium]|nr:hypothetical protein [Lachnospiraceae bacterium]
MKTRRILLAVLLIAAMVLPGCGQKVQVPELVVPIENPDAVFTARKMKLDTIYAKEGSVCPDVTDIKFDFDSEAYDVAVMIGDFVEEGDLLFRLDKNLEMKVKEAEVELTIRKKDYEVIRKRHNDQITNMKNLRSMFANMGDWYNYELWDVNIREAKAEFGLQYDNTYQEILEFEDEYLELKERFENSEIKAPVSGQVVYMSVFTEGDPIMEDTTVLSIAKQDKKLVSCPLVEPKEIKAYDEIRCVVRGKEYPATYVEVDEEELAEKKYRAQNLYSYFEVEGLPEDLEFGEYAVVYFYISSHDPVLSVPSQAVTKESGQTFVKVVSGDRQGIRPVTVGFSNKNYTEITSGLSEGEKVFVANNLVRYGVEYDTATAELTDFEKGWSTYAQRGSLTAEPFVNPVSGKIKEIHISTFSQIYVTKGQPIYTVTPDLSDAEKEEAATALAQAKADYAKKVRDDKEALEKELKRIKNMAKGVERDLAQLKYDAALEAYEKYLVDGQEYIDECQKRVDDFAIWEQGDYTVCAEQDGFLSSFAKYTKGYELKANETLCYFFTPDNVFYTGNDDDCFIRYGMTIEFEYESNGETVRKTGKVVSAYDVRPEEVTDANVFIVKLDDADPRDTKANGHVFYQYCKAQDIMTIPTKLISRERKDGTDEEEEEENDDKPMGGNLLSDEEVVKGVPYVWIYDENGQVVKRYITIVLENKDRAWVCDGISQDDRIVVH